MANPQPDRAAPLAETELAALAARHVHSLTYYPEEGGGCRCCLEPWPCPTARLLAEVRRQGEEITWLTAHYESIKRDLDDAHARGYRVQPRS